MPSPVRYAIVARMLKDKGYSHDRTAGSHFIWTKPGVEAVSIPVKKGLVKHVYVKQVQNLKP